MNLKDYLHIISLNPKKEAMKFKTPWGSGASKPKDWGKIVFINPPRKASK